MHIEILVEDSSGKTLLELLVPEILGGYGDPHTWRLHSYKGIGRIPRGLQTTADPEKRMLLDQLPKLLRGYRKSPGIDAVVVVVDTDSRECTVFLQELKDVAKSCDMSEKTMFRLAIEEMEAWYFGDPDALLEAYPKARQNVLDNYVQDSICDTWETLADAIYPGGSAAIKKVGWPLPGELKHQWAEDIGLFMDVDRNVSPSFCKLRDGLRKLANITGKE